MNCFPEKCDLLIHDCTLLNREFETEEHQVRRHPGRADPGGR